MTRSSAETIDGGFDGGDLASLCMTKDKEIIRKEKMSEGEAAPAKLNRLPCLVCDRERNGLGEAFHA